MKKLHKLHVQSSPFTVIAIVCPESHLKLSWLLNTSVGFDFKESASLMVNDTGDKTIQFPVQKDEGSSQEMIFTLVKNRIEGKNLIKSLPNIDFFLKIEGVVTPTVQKELVQRVKGVKGILGAILLDAAKVKDLSILNGV